MTSGSTTAPVTSTPATYSSRTTSGISPMAPIPVTASYAPRLGTGSSPEPSRPSPGARSVSPKATTMQGSAQDLATSIGCIPASLGCSVASPATIKRFGLRTASLRPPPRVRSQDAAPATSSMALASRALTQPCKSQCTSSPATITIHLSSRPRPSTTPTTLTSTIPIPTRPAVPSVRSRRRAVPTPQNDSTSSASGTRSNLQNARAVRCGRTCVAHQEPVRWHASVGPFCRWRAN